MVLYTDSGPLLLLHVILKRSSVPNTQPNCHRLAKKDSLDIENS